jgi:hypothetical protein
MASLLSLTIVDFLSNLNDMLYIDNKKGSHKLGVYRYWFIQIVLIVVALMCAFGTYVDLFNQSYVASLSMGYQNHVRFLIQINNCVPSDV